ncbi:MAG: hypothetical protein ABIG11_07655 [bacterium]
MEKTPDYTKIETLPKTEGREVVVLYDSLVYRVIDGEWAVVGRVGTNGEICYCR